MRYPHRESLRERHNRLMAENIELRAEIAQLKKEQGKEEVVKPTVMEEPPKRRQYDRFKTRFTSRYQHPVDDLKFQLEKAQRVINHYYTIFAHLETLDWFKKHRPEVTKYAEELLVKK